MPPLAPTLRTPIWAVLDHQLRSRESLAPEEQTFVVAYDAEAPLERARQSDAWRAVRERIDAARPVAPADPAVADQGLGPTTGE